MKWKCFSGSSSSIARSNIGVSIMVETPSSPNRWLVVLAGIIAILFGLFALVAPAAMLASLVLFFGIFAIIEAIIMLIGGIMAGGGEGSARWFVIAIAFLIGIWAFVLGLFQVFAGIAGRGAPYWWLTLIAGIIGVFVGLYIMTQPLSLIHIS